MIYRELDLVWLKGKDKPVAIFEPLSSAELATAKTLLTLDLYHDAIKSYRNCDWGLAEKHLKALGKMVIDDGESAPIVLYALYKKRIAQFKKVPPPANWVSVFNHDSK